MKILRLFKSKKQRELLKMQDILSDVTKKRRKPLWKKVRDYPLWNRVWVYYCDIAYILDERLGKTIKGLF